MSESCEWVIDQISNPSWTYFNTECGKTYAQRVCSPDAHDFKYCPYCGKPLVVKDEN